MNGDDDVCGDDDRWERFEHHVASHLPHRFAIPFENMLTGAADLERDMTVRFGPPLLPTSASWPLDEVAWTFLAFVGDDCPEGVRRHTAYFCTNSEEAALVAALLLGNRVAA